MIKECLAWIGLYDDAYLDEVAGWFDAIDSTDKISVSCLDYTYDDPNFNFAGEFLVGGGLYDDTKVVLIRDAQEWSDDDITYCINTLESSSADVYVGFTFKGGEPGKNTSTWLSEEVIDRRIGFRDRGELVEWIITWLDDRDVKIKKAEAQKIADHVGTEIALVPRLLSAFKKFLNLEEHDTMTYDEVKSDLGDLGLMPMFYIMDKISSGNRRSASDFCTRLGGESSPLGTLGYMTKQYRTMAILANDPNISATDLGQNAFIFKKIVQMAKVLGEQRTITSLSMIQKADQDMKGAGIFDPDQTFSILVDSLTRQFELARRKR